MLTQMDVAYMDKFVWTHRILETKIVSETYSSKVTGQNIKFIVIAPPFGQIAPNLTLHSLGSSAVQ